MECITSGTTPRTDGRSGLEVVRVLEAASLAMQRGRAVRLDDFSESSVPTLTLAGAPEPRVREGVS